MEIGERVIDKTGPNVMWMGRQIWLNEIYFVCYSDTPRDLTRDQKRIYDNIRLEPATLQAMEFDRDPSLSPNVQPVTGRELIELSESNKAIPQFDKYFVHSHKLTMVPVDGYDFWERNSSVLNSGKGQEVLDHARQSRIFHNGG